MMLYLNFDSSFSGSKEPAISGRHDKQRTGKAMTPAQAKYSVGHSLHPWPTKQVALDQSLTMVIHAPGSHRLKANLVQVLDLLVIERLARDAITLDAVGL